MSFQELPEEIIEKVLSFLDFKTVQKSCTLVCRAWLGLIRNSSILSGEMALDLLKNGAATWSKHLQKCVYQAGKTLEIKSILNEWKKIQTLRIPCIMPEKFDFSVYPYLRKVIIDSDIQDWRCGLNLKLKNLPWIKVSKICYDPRDKTHVRELFSPLSPETPNPEDVVELKLVLKYDYVANQPIDLSLEQIVKQMKNLESLVIQWDLEHLLQNFGFLTPVLCGLGACPKFKDLTVHFNSEGEYADEDEMNLLQVGDFFDDFVSYCPNILRLKVKENSPDNYGELYEETVSWISNLRNLEELSFSQIRIYSELDLENLYACPMRKLRRLFIYNCEGLFENYDFMIRLHATFPALEDLEFAQNCIDEDACEKWKITDLITILDSLGRVKNLSISGAIVVFQKDEIEENEIEREEALRIFKIAFNIIKKNFPKDSTEIKIYAKKFGLWIKKKKGKPPKLGVKTWYEEIKSENDSSETIEGIVSAGPGKGTIIQTKAGEQIHLSPDLISKINDASK